MSAVATAAVANKLASAKAELAAISTKVATENGERSSVPAAVLPQEVSLVQDLLLLVPASVVEATVTYVNWAADSNAV